MRRIDLHLHSTASDGVLTPGQIVGAAKSANVDVIALTDHDSIGGIAEARAVAGAAVHVIAGVELSAHDDERELHVLGLHLERMEALSARLTQLARAREERAKTMVLNLNAVGVRIEFADVLALSGGAAALGRPHIARTLVAHGWAQDHRDAFERYLLPGRPGYVSKERLTVAEAIAILHDAGGLAILAHPALEDSLDRITQFAQSGLDGVEVAHPSLTADDRARLKAVADHLGLVKSGGSDWHGLKEGPKRLGAEDVPLAWLEAQYDRVASRRAQKQVA
ncbi:MAG TPA: PHP domain-containing protein [Gemmatimonadaceae bacterium]|nr:PHP domain-containing protein [Gemmatimonadaceae bacterium]